MIGSGKDYETFDKRSLVYFIQEEHAFRLRSGYKSEVKYKMSDDYINYLYNIYRSKGGKRTLKSIKDSALNNF